MPAREYAIAKASRDLEYRRGRFADLNAEYDVSYKRGTHPGAHTTAGGVGGALAGGGAGAVGGGLYANRALRRGTNPRVMERAVNEERQRLFERSKPAQRKANEWMGRANRASGGRVFKNPKAFVPGRTLGRAALVARHGWPVMAAPAIYGAAIGAGSGMNMALNRNVKSGRTKVIRRTDRKRATSTLLGNPRFG